MGTQIRFWSDSYKNAAKTKEAGIPVFDTVPYCEIRVLGEPDNIRGPWHLMSEADRERFKDAYAAWQKDNASEGVVGTRLEAVPWLERGEVETLRHAGFRTLEDLANTADAPITRFPGGIALRKKARDMLAAAKESAPLQKMSEENARLAAEVADLKAQISEITTEKRKRKAAEG